jgi:carbonic anhydrase/acetyltransferase-like protein (isoleucine patch superfamily)
VVGARSVIGAGSILTDLCVVGNDIVVADGSRLDHVHVPEEDPS